MVAEKFEEGVAVAFEFNGTYAGDVAEGFLRVWTVLGHAQEGAVVEDDVGWHALFAGNTEAQIAQRIEEWFVGWGRRSGGGPTFFFFFERFWIFAKKDFLFSLQDGSTEFGKLQAAVSIYIYAEEVGGNELADYGLPFGGIQVCSNTVGAQVIVVEAADFFCVFSQ